MDHHSLLQSLLGAVGDFFTFRTFIAPGVIYITYYVGAVSVPVLAWLVARQSRTRLLEELRTRAPDTWSETSGLGWKGWARVAGAALATFVILEISWRMLFEFLLAYFQIREALVSAGG